MQIRVLGGVDALDADGNNVAIGGPAPTRLLALLVAGGGAEVAVDDLVVELWDPEDLPADPVATVRTYVARLRSALGPSAIDTGTGSYSIGGIETDAARFEELVERARRASGSPTASELWRQALDLWRGPAFGSLAGVASIEPEAVRLEELRAEATEAWFDARLAAGEGRELVAEIETAVARHPRREGFRAQQMTALTRAGRQADALRAFQEFRADLTEIGLVPSSRITDLDARIARGDAPRDGARRTLRGYELGERLGEGAFAIVHRATQASIGREVAIKQIRSTLADQPEFIRQFEAEAHLVARLEHPHIVPLYDYWREPGSAYLVMRHLDGGSLQGRIYQQDLDLGGLVPMIAQVAAALDEAHRSGVVHRDVKPANVLLDAAGNAYLSDFGIAVEEAERLDPQAWLSNGSPAYAAPEQLRREPVGPQADVYALGVTIYESLTGELPFPDETTMAGLLQRQLVDPIPLVRATQPEVPAAVDAVIQRATAKAIGERYQSAGELARDLATAAGLEGDDALIVPEDRNPYKGLRAFDEADAGDFVGRERLLGRLVEAVGSNRVTAVVGPSGSGKSSVVRAGLVPAVRGGRIRGAGAWFVTTMVPGSDPYADLESALLRIAVDPPADLTEELRGSERGLVRLLRSLVPEDREVLLLIDQFEELFTLSDDPTTGRFLDALTLAAADDRSRLRIVLTIRADFYDRPLRHPAFAALIEDSTLAVHPLAADELERAITEPAAAVGASFETGLVALITADVADQPGALPLLQYALTELFDARVDHTLTIEAYQRTGGVTGALARRAEDLFASSSPAEQAAIKATFGRLVTLGEGTEDTRRRVRRAELGEDAAIDAMLTRYGTARLLAFDRDPTTRAPTVEVAHEALLQVWPRLRQWLDDDRDGLRLLRHLAETATGWEGGGRPATELYRGARLEAAEEWAGEHGPELNPIEASFLAASIGQRRAEAEAEARRVSRLRRLLAAVAVVALIALAAGGLALVQRNRANDEADRASAQTEIAEEQTVLAKESASVAESQREAAELNALVSRSTAEATNRPDLGLLLAVAAYDGCGGCAIGQGALLAALGGAPPRSQAVRLEASNSYSSGAYEALGGARWIIETETGLALADASSGQIEITELGIELPVQFLLDEGRSAPEGTKTTLVEDGRIRILDTITGEDITSIDPEGELRDLRWHPDGSTLLVIKIEPATRDLVVDLVDIDNGTRAATYALPFPPAAWAIGHHGHALIASDPGPSGTGPVIAVFDLTDGAVGRSYEATFGISGNGVAARDRDVLAFGAFDDVLVVDAEAESDLVSIFPGPEGHTFGGLSADGTAAYIAQESGLKVYDTTTGRWAETIGPTYERASASVTDEDQFAQFTESGVIEIYDARARPNARRTIPTPVPAFESNITRDGEVIGIGVIGTPDYQLISTETGDIISTIQPDRLLNDAAFTLVGLGSDLGAAGAVIGAGLEVVPFALDGRALDEIDLWPRDEPAAMTAVLTSGQEHFVFGVVTGTAATRVEDRRAFLPEFLIVVDIDTMAPVGEPVDLRDLDEPVYRAVPLPDGAVIALHVDATASYISPDGEITTEVFELTDTAIQMKTDKTGETAVVLYGNGGAATIDLDTYEVSDPMVGLPGHRDVRFTPDSSALLIQDGRARTLLYDLDANEEIGFLAGGGLASAGAGSGILVTDEATVWVNRTERWLEISLDPADWRAEACRLAGRELTDDEWTEFVPLDGPRHDLCSD